MARSAPPQPVAPSVDPALASSWRAPSRLVTGLVMGVTSVVALVALLTHEMWRDESYTVMLTRSSHSIGELLGHIGFNGHPRLFYLLAYAVSKVSTSPLALALTTLVTGLAATLLFIESAPFTPLQKALYAVGFFPLYQYGVFARSYALLLLCLYAYALLKARYPARALERYVALALLAQVHLIGLAAVGVFGLMELVEMVEQRRRPTGLALIGMGLVVASMLLTVWEVWPPTARPTTVPASDAQLLDGLAEAFVPALAGILPPSSDRLWLGLGLGALSVALLLWRRQWRCLIGFLLLALVHGLIAARVYRGYRWHHGFYFIDWVVALWLWGGAVNTPRSWSQWVVVAILAVQTWTGIEAVALDYSEQYSNGKAVAARLVDEHLTDRPLVAYVAYGAPNDAVFRVGLDEAQAAVGYLPDKSYFNPVANAFESSWTHYSEPNYGGIFGAERIHQTLDQLTRRYGSPVVVLISDQTATGDWQPPPWLQRVADFPQPLDFGEHFTLYTFN